MVDDIASRRRQGVVAVILRDGRFLVIRRSASVVAPRAYCFPGGGVLDGESESQALQRELREELGVEVRPVRRIWRSVTPWNVELSWWLADLADDAVPEPNPAEVEAFHWQTPAELASLGGLLESNDHFLSALARGEVRLAE